MRTPHNSLKIVAPILGIFVGFTLFLSFAQVANAAAGDPVGYLDIVTSTSASGWTCDSSRFSQALTIHVYDGPSSTGFFLGQMTASNVYRPDAAPYCGNYAYHGYRYDFTAANKSRICDNTSHTIHVYAININTSGGVVGSGNTDLISPKAITCVGTSYTVTYNSNGATSGSAPGSQTKNYNVALTLATNSGNLAKTGYTFAGWNTSANGSGTGYSAGGSYSANAAITLYAKWTASTYTLAAAFSGSGLVTSSPTGINCGRDCFESYNYNTSVTLNASPSTGYRFTGWSGDCSGTGGCSFNMTGTKSVTANFVANFICTGTDPANAILCSGDDTGLSANTPKTLVSSCTATKCQYTCNTAGYANVGGTCLRTYTVSYNANGATSGTAPGSQIKYYGTALTLATNSGSLAKTGYTFAGWNTSFIGNGTDYSAGSLYTANAAVTLYAKWTVRTYSLVTAYSGSGTVTSTDGYINCGATCIKSYNYNTAVTLNASPSTGYRFTGWSGDCSGTGGCSFNMTGTKSVTANFVANFICTGTDPANAILCSGDDTGLSANTPKTLVSSCTATKCQYTCNTAGYANVGGTCLRTYTVSYNSNGATSGSAPGSQTKNYNVALTLATNSGNLAKTGYTFAGWNTSVIGNGTDYSAGSLYTTNAAVTLYAKWTLAPAPTVSVSWSKSDGATYYTVYADKSANGGSTRSACSNSNGDQCFTNVTATADATQTKTFTGESAATYKISVWACNTRGCSTSAAVTSAPHISCAQDTCTRSGEFGWGSGCKSSYTGTVAVGSTPITKNNDTALAPGYSGSITLACTATGWQTSNATCTAPDLTAGAITPTTATLGTRTSFSSTIRNTGTGSTGAGFTNLFQSSTNSSGTSNVSTIGTPTTAALAAGASRTVSTDYTFSSAGTFYVRVCADKSSATNQGAISESDETNNCGAWTSVTVPGICTALPSNANAYPAPDNTGLSANKAYTYSATDTSTKCQYACRSGYTPSGGSCIAAACTNLPSNASAYPTPDNTGLSANTAYTYSATDTSTKCQYTCRSGFTSSGGSCVATACTNLPSNASAYPAPDNTGLSANTAYTYSATDTATKCQYTCRSGFTSSGGSCIAAACTNLPSNASAYPTPDNTGLSANTAYTYSATDTSTKCQYTCQNGPAEYFCNDSDRYQRNTNCTEQFVETCWYGCSDGACLLPPPILPVTSGPDQLSGHLQAIPSLVRSGETTRLRWNMDNVSSCSVTGSNGDSWNGGSSGTGGKESSDIVSQTTYTLTCRPLPGAPSDDPVVELVTVNIIPIFEEL